ncbi:hypothetical protein [Nocardia sp. BMG51109]|uniref:hypothetical protein n=1 Tax=Nocardia sp. BMG51109 TaxID=1056816 RepID=UPI000467B8EB|nr:hypothetical protein [Nocardia sp. BMG51109]
MSDSTTSGHDPANRSHATDRHRAGPGTLGARTAHRQRPFPPGAARIAVPGMAHTRDVARTTAPGAAHSAALARTITLGPTGTTHTATRTTAHTATHGKVRTAVGGPALTTFRSAGRTASPGRVATIDDVRFAVVRPVPAPRPADRVRRIPGGGPGWNVGIGSAGIGSAGIDDVSAGRRAGLATAAW